MISKEDGPFMMFPRFRAYLARNQKRSGGMFDMVSCIDCLSMYIAFLASLAVAGSVVELIGYTLALSSVAVLVERLITSKS